MALTLAGTDFTDTGTWRIKDGRLCTRWTKIRNGEEACVTVYKTGERARASFLPDGTLSSTSVDID